jgi:hypothetical protein
MSEEIKGADQRRNVRGDKMSQIRAATKKPAIKGPTKIKNQHGSEERTFLQVTVVTTSEVVNKTK